MYANGNRKGFSIRLKRFSESFVCEQWQAHDDALIRERALYVLKQALLNSSGRPDDPNTFKLGEDCTAGNIRLERWSAFVFLYEILDGYESFHLAEGTLMQKVSILNPSTLSSSLKPPYDFYFLQGRLVFQSRVVRWVHAINVAD